MTYIFCIIAYFILITLYFKNININKECNFIAATGSSDNHAIYLSNVIFSFSYHNPDCELLCYNLDLNDKMYEKIMSDISLTNKYLAYKRRKGKVIFVNYTQSIYTKKFAAFSISFKPTIVYRLLNKYKRTVIWMDAGVEILKPLTAEVKIAKKYGFYMDRNKAILLQWAHPSAIRFLNYSRSSFLGLHDTDTGYLTVDYNLDFIEKVINPWYECSKHRECICPKNFTYRLYRRDQPVFSMLIYSNKPYSKYVRIIKEIKDSHIKQCDHKKGCNIIKNKYRILNRLNRLSFKLDFLG